MTERDEAVQRAAQEDRVRITVIEARLDKIVELAGIHTELLERLHKELIKLSRGLGVY